MKIAITGSIGSGKSSIGVFLREQNQEVFDTDKMVHDLYIKNDRIYQAVVDSFGKGILDSDKKINRTVLGKVVFNDPVAIKRLELIVYPEITKLIQTYEEKEKLVFYEVPMLFESGMENLFDYVLMVDTDDDIALKRMIQQRPYIKNPKERLLLQMDRSLKRLKSNYVIENNDTLDSLYSKIIEWLKIIKSEVNHDSI